MLALALIAMLFEQYRMVKGYANTVNENISKQAEYLAKSEILQFDGMKMTGAEVVNFMRKYIRNAYYEEDLCVRIEYPGFDKVFLTGMDVSELNRKEDSGYVKPSSWWECRVEENANGVITEIIFSNTY